jgi:hypothetical protein
MDKKNGLTLEITWAMYFRQYDFMQYSNSKYQKMLLNKSEQNTIIQMNEQVDK